MPADDAPAADDARAEPNAPPRRRLKREFDEHWLERCLGAPVERLLRQRRIVGACVCVVKVPMDGAPGETTDAGVVREYIRTYGYASLDPPGGAGSDASGRTNATRRTDVAWSTDPHSPRARLANNYGAVVDPRTTLFDVGSCAKIFPAVAIARLRDDLGVPELTQDADDHLPPELALASTPNAKHKTRSHRGGPPEAHQRARGRPRVHSDDEADDDRRQSQNQNRSRRRVAARDQTGRVRSQRRPRRRRRRTRLGTRVVRVLRAERAARGREGRGAGRATELVSKRVRRSRRSRDQTRGRAQNQKQARSSSASARSATASGPVVT